MVAVDPNTKEINIKVVYYGPGLSGRTTNIQFIHDNIEVVSKGKLVSYATKTDRWLSFDFIYPRFKAEYNFQYHFHLQCVPGAVFYDSCKRRLVEQADGVVFIADSQIERLDANLESLWLLEKNLAEVGIDFYTIPYVVQLNKRDLPNALSVTELKNELARKGEPMIETIAYKGIGVFETFNCLAKQIIDNCARGFIRETNNLQTPQSTLLRILHSGRWADERATAAYVLGNLKDIATTAALVAALKDDCGNVRAQAADALGKLGALAALEPLIRLLDDDNRQVGMAAIAALGKMNDPRVSSVLINRFHSESVDLEIRREILVTISRQHDKSKIQFLISAIDDSHPRIRKDAIDQLGKLHITAAIEPIIARLNDEDIDVKVAAIEALAQIGDARTVLPVVHAIESIDSFHDQIFIGCSLWNNREMFTLFLGNEKVEGLLKFLKFKK